MSIAFLNEQAHLILQQRIMEAKEARLTRQAWTLRRTTRKLQRVMIAGLRAGLAMDVITAELAAAMRNRNLAPTE